MQSRWKIWLLLQFSSAISFPLSILKFSMHIGQLSVAASLLGSYYLDLDVSKLLTNGNLSKCVAREDVSNLRPQMKYIVKPKHRTIIKLTSKMRGIVLTQTITAMNSIRSFWSLICWLNSSGIMKVEEFCGKKILYKPNMPTEAFIKSKILSALCRFLKFNWLILRKVKV